MARIVEGSAVDLTAFIADGGRKFDNQDSGGHGGRGHGNSSYGGCGHGNGSRGGRKPYIPRCQICRGEHYANKCPQFLQARAPPQVPSSANFARLTQEFTRLCNISEAPSDWYVDSRASTHMTPQPSALDTY